MAKQAGVRTVLLAKAQCHGCIGNVINLMRSRTEEHSIHDPRHMARDAAAPLARERMMRVGRGAILVAKLRVATSTHEIRLIFEFE